MEHTYEVTVNWLEDRKGTMHSPVLDQSIEVATPPEFPKGMEGFWSPEHLLVAAVNSCLMTTFLAIAENSKLEFLSFRSSAKGKLAQSDGKLMITQIVLAPEVLTDEKNAARAERVLQKAEANCLISHSVRSEIIFKPVIRITENPALINEEDGNE